MSLLSLALRQSASTGSLPSSSSSPAVQGSLTFSASVNNIAETDFELLFEDEDNHDEDDAPHTSSPRSSLPRDTPLNEGQQRHHQQQHRVHFKAAALGHAWDMPAPHTTASACTGAMCMARSLPRPISGPRLAHLTGREDDSDEEHFVPPHLASSMIEPKVCESISTAKGAAALRLRSQMLRRTGYLEGRMGGPGTSVPSTSSVRIPS